MAGRIKNQGSNWIWKPTRLRIYARDHHACQYCGRDIADPRVRLSLDHVVPCELGGENEPTNLVTCCISCNSAKRDFPLGEFLAHLGDLGQDPELVARRVRNARRRRLPTGG